MIPELPERSSDLSIGTTYTRVQNDTYLNLQRSGDLICHNLHVSVDRGLRCQ